MMQLFIYTLVILLRIIVQYLYAQPTINVASKYFCIRFTQPMVVVPVKVWSMGRIDLYKKYSRGILDAI